MELYRKLEILSQAAKYDVSCASSGSTRQSRPGGLGNTEACGICHSWSDDGRCISLLKVLMSNICMYNCAYCVNRADNDVPRAFFTPDEIIELTMGFYRRNYIEGLFLSSGVFKSPDYTMELMLQVVKRLRSQHRYNGYIHLKAIPGCDTRLIEEAGLYADRMSVNIELSTEKDLRLLAPQKDHRSVFKPMGFISSKVEENREETRICRRRHSFVPAGQSTQLIVGATGDHDISILGLSERLYKRYSLKRVYYSAYVPVNHHPALSASRTPLVREHRLYQADWLLRFYGFNASELLDDSSPDLELELDPKSSWALRNPQFFPVEINRAAPETLLRVPGIGLKSAHRIISARRVHSLDFGDLKKIGVVLKRARFFITCRGKYMDSLIFNERAIREGLLPGRQERALVNDPGYSQISFLPPLPQLSAQGLPGLKAGGT